MPAWHRDKAPWLVARIPLRPCAAWVGRQGARPHCRCASSTASKDRARLQENRFRSHDIQRRTANEDRVLSPAKHRNRHPHSAIWVSPCSVSVLGKVMITDFWLVCPT